MVASHERQSASGRLQIVTDVVAHLGWSVIPVGINKKPLFSWKQYQKERPTIEQVEQWQKQYNPPAWAVITGAISNLVILDGDGEAGRETFEQLVINPHRKTGSGGWHCDFQHPGWYVPTLNSKSKIELGERWPGLDIRGDGGYAIFCGRNTSGEYTWLRTPGELDSLDALPKNLRNFLGLLYPPEEKTRRSLADVVLEKYLNEASMRGRDNACFALAKQLHDNNYSQSEAESVCMDFARRCSLTDQHGNVDLFTEESARQKVASAYSYAKREPWEGLKSNHQNGRSKHAQNGKDDTAEKDVKPEKKEASVDQAAMLVDMALSKANVFATPKGEVYAQIRFADRIETITVSDKGAFKRWLMHEYHELTGIIPQATALFSAVEVIVAKAEWGTREKKDVFVRKAFYQEKLYIDLANKDCQVIEVDKDGWRVLSDNIPVSFRRPEGMLPLPVPVRGGKLSELKPFVNISDQDDWLLLQAWLLGSYHPEGPYPVLGLSGEGGSAKSSMARYVRRLIDPHEALLRREPKDEQTFSIMAHNSYVVALDNLSRISNKLSDMMCTLATGSGDAFRKHYSNNEEVIFNEKRPQIFTGIEELATRGDLIDRCILLSLPTIDKSKRRDEKSLNQAFDEAHPRMLGALLDIISLAMHNLPNTHLDELPRMADFALWVQAAEEAITDEKGSILRAYYQNKEKGIEFELEASPIGKAIIDLMSSCESWHSSTTDLLKSLTSRVDEKTTFQRAWPKNARALSGLLTRITPSFRVKGIIITQGRGNKGSWVDITKKNTDPGDAKPESFASPETPFASPETPFASPETPFASPENGSTTDSNPYVTQSDAKKTDSFSSEIQKKEDIGEDSSDAKTKKNSSENLRHFASPSGDAAIPDSLDYVDIVCPQCGCGLTRLLVGTPACVRCYPPKDYHTYSHLVDMIYPRIQKTSFGKKGA